FWRLFALAEKGARMRRAKRQPARDNSNCGPASQREDRMNALRLLVAAAMVFALTSSVWTEERQGKDTAKLLVGTWEATKTDKDHPLAGGDTTEFTKDGKNKTTHKKDGKVNEGTYKFVDDKLVLTFKSGDNVAEIGLMIKKISDTELVISHIE